MAIGSVEETLTSPTRRTSKPGGPTWEVAYLFPAQGQWTEEEYLALTSRQFRYILGQRHFGSRMCSI